LPAENRNCKQTIGRLSQHSGSDSDRVQVTHRRSDSPLDCQISQSAEQIEIDRVS
jgi:hypothetical protein